jgi:hypothetical protein
VLGIIAGYDKNQFRLFRRKHLMMIGVGPPRAKKAGTMRRPVRIEVADRHEVHRREGECGIDVAESMGAGPDETDAQFAGVFVVVSDVLDKEDVPLLFDDDLAIRRGKDNKEQRFGIADIGGAMPHLGQNRDGVPRLHFGFRAVGHRVEDLPLDDDEDFAAVRMIVARIAAAGFQPAVTHRDFAAVAERAASIPVESAPVEIEPFRLFGGEKLNGFRHGFIGGSTWLAPDDSQ